jgi:hypothetical protein
VGAYGWGVGQQAIGNMDAAPGNAVGTAAGAQGSAAGYAPDTVTLVQSAYDDSFNGGNTAFNSQYEHPGDAMYPTYYDDNGPVKVLVSCKHDGVAQAPTAGGQIALAQGLPSGQDADAALCQELSAGGSANFTHRSDGSDYFVYYRPDSASAWAYTGLSTGALSGGDIDLTLPVYAISYASSDKTGGDLPGTVYVAGGAPYVLADNTLSRTGYTADGWVVASNQVAGDQVDGSVAAGTVSAVGSDLTFWANWQADTVVPPVQTVVAPSLGALAAPAAVVMGGAGSVESAANVGPGAKLALAAPQVTSWGGGASLGQGWQIYLGGQWKAFDATTYMSLSYNHKELRYYATNSAGTTYSNVVTICVRPNSLYPILAGKDRYYTSALTALEAWTAGSKYAVLATGEDYKDALAANYLAGALDAPLLLLSPKVKHNVPVANALKKLGASKVYVVGGAVTKAMAASVGFKAATWVSKATDGLTEAVDVLKYVVSKLHRAAPTAVAITTTSGYADAVAASAYVANPGLNLPVLFVKGKDDASKAAAELQALGSVKTVYVLGSTKAVSARAAAALKSAAGPSARMARLWGANRNLTAAAVFATFAPKVAKLDGGHLASVGIVCDNAFADALGAGVAQAHLGGAVMPTPAAKVGTDVHAVLTGGSFKSGTTTYQTPALQQYLTNFCFYGSTMSTAVRKAISGYVK